MGEAGQASSAEVSDFYDEFAQRQTRVGVNRRHEAIVAWLRRFGLRPDDRVLELGCGVGTVTGLLAAELPRGSILGVDLSPRSIATAQERLASRENVSLMAADVVSADVDGQYDVVLLPDVIEHIPLELHDALFSRIASWVKPDGFVLLHYPNPHHLEWFHEHHPERLQIIDQPIHADALLANAYRHGLHLDYYERYSIWVREGDYVVAVLRPASGVGEFTRLPQPRPSLATRAMRRIKGVARPWSGGADERPLPRSMKGDKPDLVLFARRFPYGEAALRGELAVTAPRFRRVFVIPSQPGGAAAELPPNATEADLGWSKGWSRTEKLRALGSRATAKVLGRTLRHRSNWGAYAAHPGAYLDNLTTNLLRARSLRRWIAENELGDALFYDYWFENSTLALAVLRDLGAIRCAVSRAHGFDLFDYRWGGRRRVPFREYKAEYLDAIFPISEDGVGDLRAKVGHDGEKVRLARLGVPRPSAFPRGRADPPLVVSCSVMRPQKRIHLIPEVLRECGQLLHWVHFGDGPELGRVEAAAAALPETVTWDLRGWVDNAGVHDFYANHPVSAFLSVSAAEGVPISMMEAQSYGVPIVALAVGGVPEIVSDEAGELLSADSSTGAIAEALAGALGPGRFDADRIRSIFAARFDASANYEEFADALLEIWSERVLAG